MLAYRCASDCSVLPFVLRSSPVHPPPSSTPWGSLCVDAIPHLLHSSHTLSPSRTILFPSSMPYNHAVKATQWSLPIPTGFAFFFFQRVGLLYLRKAQGWPGTKKASLKKLSPKKKMRLMGKRMKRFFKPPLSPPTHTQTRSPTSLSLLLTSILAGPWGN